MDYEKIYGFRFMITGMRDNLYGIKDLKDCITEFYSYSDVLMLSKTVKIAVVVNDNINLMWFRDYFSRALMAYGMNKFEEMYGLTVDSNGMLHKGSVYWSKFIEFIDDFESNDGHYILMGGSEFNSALHGSGFINIFNTKEVVVTLELEEYFTTDIFLKYCKAPVENLVMRYFCREAIIDEDFCKDAMIPTFVEFVRLSEVVLSNAPSNKNVIISFGRSISNYTMSVLDPEIPKHCTIHMYSVPVCFIVNSIDILVKFLVNLRMNFKFRNEFKFRYFAFSHSLSLTIYDMNNGDIHITDRDTCFWILNFTQETKIFISGKKFRKIESEAKDEIFEKNHGVSWNDFLSVCIIGK